jgi:transketolase
MLVAKSQNLSKEIRHNILRAILKSKASHIASALSIVDVLAVLYDNGYVNPHKTQFFLSKGHAGIAVYSTLRAINIISEDMFQTYYCNGSHLGGHISHKNVPGVSLSTGSLGGGIAVANGVALANKINKTPESLYIIVGDGECGEGSIWEAALFAAHHKLNDITVIVDRNRLQGCGHDKDIMDLGDIGTKFLSFGWDSISIDGHNLEQLNEAFKSKTTKPKCIIANTVKGKGVNFMENNNLWHYKNVIQEDYELALAGLGLS